ncbi:unnamed protein product [Rotaria socialis]|uniref:Uncharacterized protein n=2 Tax=Rotaria socialis TaxID=392032 RepID=A0A818GDB6_9BILA|nr:unnamed protein product [Rotaria socialis]CAF3489809.1 unnamed protein product [Rotaria socialis]
MNFHIHITLHPQQPIINVNANPVFNNKGSNNNYIPANPMGFYAQQHGTTMPPMRMQQADYAHSYNDYYTQQTHMTSSGNYKEQMGSIIQACYECGELIHKNSNKCSGKNCRRNRMNT